VYGSPVPHRLAATVRERTDGNPYWLTELVVAAAGQGPRALTREPLPGHLRLGSPADSPDGAPDISPAVSLDAELTAREIEVLSCLAAGMSNKQVARSLGISVRTVTVHVSNLLRKTGSTSRTEAALWAVRHRQVRPVQLA
jgi:DNA-binding NarL/FixJ family response regulator